MSSGNPPLGKYHFLSWARRGIGASVNNVDSGGLPAPISKAELRLVVCRASQVTGKIRLSL